MARKKIAITIDKRTLAEIDKLVRAGFYPSRSGAFEAAIKDRVESLQRSPLARECVRLDKAEEQSLANEGFAGEPESSEY